MSTWKSIQILIEMNCVIYCVIFGILLHSSRNTIFREGKVLSYAIYVNATLLISDALSWLADGKAGTLFRVLAQVTNYSIYLLEFVLILFICDYMYSCVRRYNPAYPGWPRRLVYCIIGVDLLLLLSNPWTGIFFRFGPDNRYIRSGNFELSMLLAGFCLLLQSLLLLQSWRRLDNSKRLELILFLFFPALGAIVQFFVYGMSLVNLGLTLSTFSAFGCYIYHFNRWTKERELKNLKSQAYLLNSQIKPHFLFNCLNVIEALIEEDPDTAILAVNRFSKFLRIGMKIETMDSMVPITKELEYVGAYLYLEQLRYGDKIRVVKEIDPMPDFRIPFLTLQPLVENAVRHGIRQRIEGGTITIHVEQMPDYYEIRIEDDGVGFLPIDTEVKNEREWDPDNLTSHGVGMTNVRNRLVMMCGGTLTIDSAPGCGTTVTIRIPIV
ncbi:MAG: histidine kinase [Lachnospiraceae bacterium]|nr:histidine kinase [Lachnospiraceae bacterium]